MEEVVLHYNIERGTGYPDLIIFRQFRNMWCYKWVYDIRSIQDDYRTVTDMVSTNLSMADGRYQDKPWYASRYVPMTSKLMTLLYGVSDEILNNINT